MADNTKTLTLTLQVKDDGSVVVDTVKSKIDQLNQSTTSGGKSITDVLGGMKAGWLAVSAAVVAGYKTIESFVDAASEAEQIESRMAFQINAVGYEFAAVKPLVDDFADSILRMTSFSDEAARQGLGQMMQYTTDLSQAMKGTKLSMDVSTQTGMDLNSAIRQVGMAMNGNVEILGRWIPELRDLDSTLGSNATQAEKAAYSLELLIKKFGGAAEEDLKTFDGRLKQLKNSIGEFRETVGKEFIVPGLQNWVDWANLIGQSLIKARKDIYEFGLSVQGFDPKELAGRELQRLAHLEQEANIKAAIIKAAEDERKAEEKRAALAPEIEKATWDFYAKEATLRGDRLMALEIQQRFEIQGIWDKYKTTNDVYKLISAAEQTHHREKLTLLQKEKEEEYNATLSLATMWKGYYDERIGKENEIIGLIKQAGIETTIGTKFEFAGIEDQFRKIAEKAEMFTEEEFEKIKAAYLEKLKGVAATEGGTWEEISVPTGKEMGQMGPRTTWGTDYRWRETAMTEEQRRIEQMREESMRRIETMGKGAVTGAPESIIATFDQTRQKAVELQQTIEQIKNQKLQIDTSRLVDAMNQIDEFEDKLISLVQGSWNVRLGVEIVGDELVQRVETQLGERITNKRSSLGQIIQKNIEGVVYYSNE